MKKSKKIENADMSAIQNKNKADNRWTTLETYYGDAVKAEFAKEAEEHIPSGQLSASALAKPLLWQILKTIGVPRKELDTYVLMTFDRGRQVEDLFLERLPITDRQKKVEYRGVVGLLDGIVEFEGEKMPLEVKSVKYMKFKRIKEEADDQYILQATLYGMAEKTKHIGIAVVDTQSGTPKIFRYATNLMSRRIEGIIDAYNMAFERKFMPVFEPLYKWQTNPEYSDYPEFGELSGREIVDLLKLKYPKAYKKWQSK